MAKWKIVIDVAKCHDCNNCFMACKDEFFGNDFPPYSLAQPRHEQRWINIDRKERGKFPHTDVAYLPVMCMHCENAPCIEASDGAVYRREDGIVLIDPEKAKGKKEIVDSCPYHAIYWNEEKNIPQKCTGCAHLLDQGWEMPRCVQACPTGALTFVKDEKDSDDLQALFPEKNTHPRVLYKNLHRYNKFFVASSLIYNDECLEGAKISLKDASGNEKTMISNGFGDFKIDDVEKGTYQLTITSKGLADYSCEVKVNDSVCLDDITMNKK